MAGIGGIIIILAIPILGILGPLIEGTLFENIANGVNYWYISLTLLIIIIIYQYKKIKEDLNMENKTMQFIAIFGTCFGYVHFFAGLLACFKIYWLLNLLPGVNALNYEARTFWGNFFQTIFQSGVVAGGTIAFFMVFFRLGIFTAGVSFCIALHNYFNGMSFDLGVLIKIIFEINLPDILGILITVSQLLGTTFSDQIVSFLSNILQKIFTRILNIIGV